MKKQKFINIVLLVVVIIVLALGLFFYFQYRSLEKNSEIVNKEIKGLVLKVSKIYLLPEGEEPTVATVSDPEILKRQSFFTLSEKGDKVLIYPKAGKAILYRPSIDKIIESAPVSGVSNN